MIWHRKSPRLSGCDYSQDGGYFVTVCVQGRVTLLGEIIHGGMRLNQAGYMVERWWHKLESKFSGLKTDFYVVMPNHFHGIALLAENTASALPACRQGAHMGAPLQKIVQWFKTMTTNEYIHGVKEHGWPQFKGSLWQRSFYDHVIRDEASLNRIREYISTNPLRWDLDRENPRSRGSDEFDRWLAACKTRPVVSTRRGGPMCPPPDPRRQLGDHGEDLAVAALKQQGYRILERNYVTPLGEIDLIARQGKVLVVVEVKTRKSTRFGSPQEGVSGTKQGRLRRLADYYLKAKGLTGSPVRFDVVAVTLAGDGPRVEIIQEAF
ncbi:MAG TPA: YraN family protein [Desulfobaccales bacterium]|nr:YraN family protein [Desulfobaccales bacterium]